MGAEKAVTSTHPLRLYVYPRMWVTMAGSVYDSDVSNKCIHDTHAHAKGKCDGGLTVEQRQVHFDEYARLTNMPQDMQTSLIHKSRDLLARVIHNANPDIQKHIVNQGIYDSGASCFSFMRADLGMTEDGDPVLFEINQFPYVDEEAAAPKSVVFAAHMELFQMMGIDQPPVYGEEERRKFEAAHAGLWELLIPP